ncbi:MAG: phosphoglucosamine mutase, partial [Candidatus Thermoplasmatota archaeon]|nr:phosphoglucosamine mutase [Candidatus Thermoplasmatota archaeon]
TTGEMFSRAIAAGLMAAGANVTDVGLVSTPTLAQAARNHGCGIMVTASHNPPKYNGIKLWNPDSTSFTQEQSAEVERRILEKDFTLAGWDNVGQMVSDPNAIRDHMEMIKKAVGRTDGLKVVLDCGSGAGSTITPMLLREMGCSVVSLNTTPDGFFPARDPEPLEEHLGLLLEMVKKHGADLGLAHDGDADRMVAVDENGRYLGGDILMLIFGTDFVGKRVVVPVNATMALDDLVGGDVHRCRVGDVFVTQMLKEVNGNYGGEPSATWTFPEFSYCPDGVYAAARIAKMAHDLKRQGKTLGQLVDGLPRYPVWRKDIPYPADGRSQIVKEVYDGHRAMGGEINDADGIRAAFSDGWVLIRASGTEPKFRITAEAKGDARAKELHDMSDSIVQKAISKWKGA